MAVYDFNRTYTFENAVLGSRSGVIGVPVDTPHISPYMPSISQSSDNEGGRIANQWESGRVSPEDVHTFIEPGFRYLDEAMKNYWSDIRIPTKDSSRFLKVKIAGVDRTLDIWNEDIKNGRITLPVASISRLDHSYNVQKFSPAYHATHANFLDRQRTRAELHYRPVPYNVSYSVTILASYKRDAEYVFSQVLSRFNPLAELRVSDKRNIGNVQMILSGSKDASDKEASADQWAKIKYEVSYVAEAWLSIATKSVPTILGSVVTTKELVNNGVTGIINGPLRY